MKKMTDKAIPWTTWYSAIKNTKQGKAYKNKSHTADNIFCQTKYSSFISHTKCHTPHEYLDMDTVQCAKVACPMIFCMSRQIDLRRDSSHWKSISLMVDRFIEVHRFEIRQNSFLPLWLFGGIFVQKAKYCDKFQKPMSKKSKKIKRLLSC